MIRIDGSFGEGGRQILGYFAEFSHATAKAFRLRKFAQDASGRGCLRC